MMMVWCRKGDTHAIYSIVKYEDKTAYITKSYVKSVYGNGFDALKLKKRKRIQTPPSKE